METAAVACLLCKGQKIERIILKFDEPNDWVEFKSTCAACGYVWIEAHQNGTFVKILWKAPTKADFERQWAEEDRKREEKQERQREKPEIYFRPTIMM